MAATKPRDDRAELPDGPRIPPLAQTLLWLFRPTELMDACRRRYGETFTLRLAGFPPAVMFSTPDAIRDIFTGDPDVLLAGQDNAMLKPLLGESSVLLLDGPRHLRHRKLLLPPFHGERMKAYGDTMRDITRAVMATWPTGRPFSLHGQMQEIALQTIVRTVFGITDAHRFAKLTTLLKALLATGEQPLLLLMIRRDGGVRFGKLHQLLGRASPWTRFQRLIDAVDAILFDEIARRRQQADRGSDILSLLLLARDEAGAALTDAELRDELLTMLVAGHETTTTALVWTVYDLLRHPPLLGRLQEELARQQHDYLDAVIRETLRLHPVFTVVGRHLDRPMSVAGRTYPANTVLTPSIYLTQRNPRLWPDPERFEPERFLNQKISPYEYFPFGGGSRRCLGMSFSLYQMRIVLAEIFSSASLSLLPGYVGRRIRRGLTFTLPKGLPVVMTAR